MASESAGGVSDSVQVALEGWAEFEEKWNKTKNEVFASIPVCPECGADRRPVNKWKGWRDPQSTADVMDTHPPIKCFNEECTARPRMMRNNEW